MSTVAPPSDRRISALGHDITPMTAAEVAAAAAALTPRQRDILLHAATEAPFCSGHLASKGPGTYICVLGGLPLFRASAKFDSGTGWPSFWEPIDPKHVIEREDDSHGMRRVEILDARSGGHLGHVFYDGPKPTGKRYCLNGEILQFIPDGEPLPTQSQPVRK